MPQNNDFSDKNQANLTLLEAIHCYICLLYPPISMFLAPILGLCEPLYYSTNVVNMIDYVPYIAAIDTEQNISKLMDITTSKEILETIGYLRSVSFDHQYAASINMQTNPPEVYIVEIQSGQILHTIVAPNPGDLQNPFIGTLFTRDNEDLTIFYMYINRTQVIDVATGQVRFSVTGGVWLTKDSQYLVSSGDDGYSHSQLAVIDTGQVLYEVEGGNLILGGTQKYLLRKEGYDGPDWQVIDIETGEVVYERHDYFLQAQFINNDQQLALGTFSVGGTEIIDIETGLVIHHLEEQFIAYENCHPYYIVTNREHAGVMDADFHEVYLMADRIQFSNDCHIIIAERESSIDIYEIVSGGE